jgi:hypothetical protein
MVKRKAEDSLGDLIGNQTGAFGVVQDIQPGVEINGLRLILC